MLRGRPLRDSRKQVGGQGLSVKTLAQVLCDQDDLYELTKLLSVRADLISAYL
jgi:hypothetical protein